MMVMCMNNKGPSRSTAHREPIRSTTRPTASSAMNCPSARPDRLSRYITVAAVLGLLGRIHDRPDSRIPTRHPRFQSITSDVAGPWLVPGKVFAVHWLPDQAGHQLSISARPAQQLRTSGKINRHFGFGATTGTVTISRVPGRTVTGWSDAQITVTVPAGDSQLRQSAAGAVRRLDGAIRSTTSSPTPTDGGCLSTA